MRILVLIKQVPDIESHVKVTIDEKSHSINRSGIPSIMNPPDKNALEEALIWKDKFGYKITVITMGPTQANEILKEAISMGADEAYLLTDRSFAGSDTWSTSLILSTAIKKLGDFAFIFAGKQALDGDTGQVGPGVASRLNIPQILNVKSVLNREKDSITIIRNFNHYEETIQVEPPALLTFCRYSNQPRLPSLKGLFQSVDYSSPMIDNSHLKIQKDNIGIDGSPTKVFKTFKPVMDKTVKKVYVDNGEEMYQILQAIIEEVK